MLKKIILLLLPCLSIAQDSGAALSTLDSLTFKGSVTQSLGAALTPLDSLTFKGYFRTTLGESEGRKTMVNFIAPGAQARYRLGNEPNTYAELELGYNRKLNEYSNKSFDLVVMANGYSGFGEQGSFKLDEFVQFYVKMNNAIGSSDVWVGRRYNERKDHHINDYFWYRPNQGATASVGIENIRGKTHKDDIVISLSSFDNKNIKPFNDTIDKVGVLKNYILETQWKNIPVNNNGNITVWGRLSDRPKNDNLNYKSSTGYGVGIWHEQAKIFNGNASNILQLSYKKGNAMSIDITPIYETLGSPSIHSYNLNKAYAFEVSNQLGFEKEKVLSFSAIALYRLEDRGLTPYEISTGEKQGNGQKIHWFTTGARVIKYISRHFNIAVEAGSDYVDNQTIDKRGWLHKVTLAPQLSWDYGFYSRPVIRPFVTYANWSDDLVGRIGNAPDGPVFNNKNNGLTYGVSFEIWW